MRLGLDGVISGWFEVPARRYHRRVGGALDSPMCLATAQSYLNGDLTDQLLALPGALECSHGILAGALVTSLS